MGDVQSLQSIVGKFNQTNSLLDNYSLTFMSDATYAWLEKYSEPLLWNMYELTNGKKMCHEHFRRPVFRFINVLLKK